MEKREIKVDNEQIYDEQISPLVQQIIEICKKNEMPHFLTFEYSEGNFCTTANRFNGHGVFIHYDVLKQCAMEHGVNVDKYIMWLLKQKNTSSVCLALLGNSPASRTP